MTAKPKRRLRISLLIAGICVLMTLIIVLAFPLHLLLYCSLNTYTKTGIKHYERLLETNDVMPRLDAIGDTLDVDFKLTQHATLLYVSTAYLLIASYDEKEYNTQKQAVLQRYVFEEEPITDRFGETFTVRFVVDGFDFGVLSMEKYDGWMPKKFYCIGTSDSEHKIAYLHFLDLDLDQIPSWEDILRRDCGWK